MGVDGKNKRAHRLSWEFYRGEIPEGMCVCHHCDMPGCVNPAHLFVGTVADNNADMIKKGRVNNNGGRCGEEHWCAKLTAKDVVDIRRSVAQGKMTQADAARKFDVDTGLIAGIIHRKYWKHV